MDHSGVPNEVLRRTRRKGGCFLLPPVPPYPPPSEAVGGERGGMRGAAALVKNKKESWKRGSYVIKGRGCALRVSPETLLIFISNYSGYSIIRMPFCMNKGSVLPRRIFWWGVYITLRHLLFLYLTQISIFFLNFDICWKGFKCFRLRRSIKWEWSGTMSKTRN